MNFEPASNSIIDLLQKLSNSDTCSDADVKRFLSLLKSTEIRDYDEIGSDIVVSAIFSLLAKAWKFSLFEMEIDAWQCWLCWREYPEFETAGVFKTADKEFTQLLIARFEVGSEQFVGSYKEFLHGMYFSRKDLRVTIRASVGAMLSRLSAMNPRKQHVAPLLNIIEDIISGFRSDAGTSASASFSSWRSLLNKVLLPLHSPNEMIDWRDQIPVIQRYHEALLRCIVRLAEKEDEVVGAGGSLVVPGGVLVHTLDYLLQSWPEGYGANTPKEVLFLHEVETVLNRVKDPQNLSLVVEKLLLRFDHCLRHDNARPMQRALTMFKNENVLRLLAPYLNRVYEAILPALFRDGRLNWNPTVNRMTALALQSLETLNPEAFEVTADRLFGAHDFNAAKDDGHGSTGENVPKIKTLTTKALGLEGHVSKPSSDNTEGLADQQARRDTVAGHDPSITPLHTFPPPKRGRAPVVADHSVPRVTRWVPGTGPPPVTVTGVAPWAFNNNTQSMLASKAAGVTSGIVPSIRVKSPSPMSEGSSRDPIESPTVLKGLAALRAFTARCFPMKSKEELDHDAANHWSNVQSLPSPSLLPDLRFHDLVFGRDLGSGSFATVRYARHILKGKTRSDWPEYAVKIIAIANYEPSRSLKSQGRVLSQDTHANREAALAAALREIAILQMLTHPGIARMISAFRYTGALYLVLEYGSRGDLHSHVIEHGPLDHREIKFVAGEVLAALLSIAEFDLSFNDLKPENVVITEPGHVKLVDFGACRPVTTRGINMLTRSAQAASTDDEKSDSSATILRNMRSGDWREGARRPGDASTDVISEEDERFAWQSLLQGGDDSIEGTPAYLPPEMLTRLQGETFTCGPGATDAWSLGCLLHFLRVGRPKYFGDREQVVMQQTRDEVGAGSDVGVRFGVKEKVDVSVDHDDRELDDLTALLLRFDPRYRLALADAVTHPYLSVFEGEVRDPLRLHWGVPIPLERRERGIGRRSKIETTGGTSEGAWSQRQLSKVWSPLPPTYDLSAGKTQKRRWDDGEMPMSPELGCWEGAIDETDDELGHSFLPTTSSFPSNVVSDFK